MLHEGVLQGIRGMLPVKNILREYLKEDADDDVEEESEQETKVSKNTTENKDTKAEVEPEAEAEPDAEAEAEESSEVIQKETIGAGIKFTGNDTQLGTPVAPPESVEEEEVIQILDEPPEAMDEFEDIEHAESILPMDFEEIS